RDGTITLAADLADQRRQEALDGIGECRYPINCIGPGLGIKETDHRYRRSLRTRRERPSGYTAAEKCDEVPPPHGAYPKAKDQGGSIAGVGVVSGSHRNKKRRIARRARGRRQRLRGLSLTQRSCGPDRAARPCRLLDHLVGEREQLRPTGSVAFTNTIG